MRAPQLVVIVLFLIAFAGGADCAPVEFTEVEREWIKANPVVHYASDSRLPPIEYVQDGEYRGLSAEYLNSISRISGLKFVRVPTDTWHDAQQAFLAGRADLFPNVIPSRVGEEVREKLTFSRPYFSTPSIIVTESGAPVVLSMNDLKGKVVAIRRGGSYAATFAERYPEITTLQVDTPDEALVAIADGRAYAAVGTEATFPPLMRRKYSARLNISGTIPDLPFMARVGVRADMPVLMSIVRKSLASLSAEETDIIYDHWLSESDYGAPSMESLLRYRGPQIALLSAFILLLGWLVYNAHSAKRQARNSERVKSRFLAMMSHEIRTPINAIIGSIELLQLSPLDERQRRLATTAAHATEALGALLDDVLDLSKIDEKGMRLEQIPTDLNLLVRNALDVTRVGTDRKKLALVVHSDTIPGSHVVIDPTRFRQVVMNLLGNAVKFTEVGSITFSYRVARLAKDSDDARIQVTVQDSGIGIPAEQQSHLFEAYSQADASTTRRYGGTGLGLTICRELVALMGGDLSLSSKLGQGTTVQFSVPTRIVPAPDVHTPGSALSSPARSEEVPLVVLLVEDHPDNQFVIGEQLLQLGVRPQIVDDGLLALEALTTQRFAMVLMDCHMPNMDGYETTRRIRAAETEHNLPRSPIVAISAATDAEHLKKCLDCGMDGILKKPLRVEDLRSMLQLWLPEVFADRDVQPPRMEQPTDGDYRIRYRTSVIEDMTRLSRSLDDHDDAQVRYLAHRIRGAALMAGDNALADWLSSLEEGVAGGRDPQPALDQHLARVRAWAGPEGVESRRPGG